MPQLKAAKKALRQSARKRTINDRWRKKVRLAIRAVQDAVNTGNKDKAQESFITAQKTIDRAAKHNILHRNKASRKKSQLQKAVSTIKSKK